MEALEVKQFELPLGVRNCGPFEQSGNLVRQLGKDKETRAATMCLL